MVTDFENDREKLLEQLMKLIGKTVTVMFPKDYVIGMKMLGNLEYVGAGIWAVNPGRFTGIKFHFEHVIEIVESDISDIIIELP